MPKRRRNLQKRFNSGLIIDYLCKDNEKVLSVHSADARLLAFRPRTIRSGCVHVEGTPGSRRREIRACHTELQHSYAARHHRLLELLLPRNSQVQSRRLPRSPDRLRHFRTPESGVHQRLSLPRNHREPCRKLRSRVQGLRPRPGAAPRRDRHIFLARSHLLSRPALRGRRAGLRPLHKERAEGSGRIPQPGSLLPLPLRHHQGALRLQPGDKARPLRTRGLHTPRPHIFGTTRPWPTSTAQ